ncbi:hypothetical protein SMD20_25790 [Nonomuraea sp. LP-02]|uniref:hypothetical protein n=1 Tax=Nonomuraea sp. LP-02 TaxID=3097960 RepID=UPI002E2F22AF|nr:hypothetical protein [Nonomuraea sp. LP-02]MED7927699.1 hypothetical protein [Nonomuraea sp. LP-02]
MLNAYYAAAVQAGSQSWKAFFSGASDAANAITRFAAWVQENFTATTVSETLTRR